MPERPRRVVLEKAEEKQDRTGRLAIGAILGVVAGIMIGIYALPPILRGFYGETTVEANTTYEGDGRTIRVVGWEVIAEDPFDVRVTVDIRSNKSWDISLADWTLEVEGIKEWQRAASAESNGQPGHAIPLAEDVRLSLQFLVEGSGTEIPTMEALHLANPRLKFLFR
ncbi:MAG TPA: hypothetical protein PJ994_07285 [Tepidiformaceae bacterium]|nr:hypothetical protein [Tepidiformaceae bacterium]